MAKHKGKVLVIEDDEYARDALARLLAAEGYQTQSAADGETGLSTAQALSPDIIILDLSLPGIDGRQVIQLLRSDSTMRSIPILILTAHDEQVAQSAVELGADDYLTKPVEIDQLISKISEFQAQALVSR